jgi:hypothetical protein
MLVAMYGTMWGGGSSVYGHHFLTKLPKKIGDGGRKELPLSGQAES